MQRIQVRLTILAAAVVVAVTFVSLGAFGLAAGAGGWQYDRAEGVNPYWLAVAFAVQNALVAAGLYGVFWWTVIRPLNEIDRYAASVRGQAAGSRPMSAVPAPGRPCAGRNLAGIRDTLEYVIQLLHSHVAELRKNQVMLSTVLDSVPYFVWWKDAKGVYLGCNQAFVAATGYRDSAEVVGKTDADLPWRNEEARGFRADDREVLASNRAKRHVVERFTFADGSCRWADTTKVPLADADGRPYGVMGVAEDITERKEAEEALRGERALNEAILSGMPGVLFLHDEHGRLVKWNARAREVYGFSDAELKGKHFLDWMPEDQQGRTLAAVNEVIQFGHTEMDADVILKGGTRVPHYITGTRLMVEGKPYMLVVGIDLSERKRTEEALLREKAITDAIFSSMPGLLYLYDDQGRLVRWNRKGDEIMGLADKDLSRWRLGDAIAGEDRERIRGLVRRVLSEGVEEAAEATLLTARGPAPYYLTGVRVMIDGKPYLLGVGIDISEWKRAEEALLREKAISDAVFDNVPAVLCLFDDHQRPVRWNRRSKEISGFSDEEYSRAQKVLWDTAEAKSKITEAINTVLRVGQADIEEVLVTKGGMRIPYYYTGVRLMLDGKPHVLGVGIDITERKRAEEHLRRALKLAEEANRSKDQFLAAASHELRTPLMPVLLLTSSLENNPHVPADARRDLAVIREHVEVEKRLIGDLLDFSAIHAGKLHIHRVPTDAHDVLRAAIRTCQDWLERKQLRLDVRLDARDHYVSGDPDRLRQVFWNLIQNAFKFTPDRGLVSVRTNDDDGHTLRVEVTDTGRGMNADTLQRLFRPFEQGPRDERIQHYGGLGLGLAISKNLVEAHGGSISAISAGPERGSTFVVRLPVSAEVSPPVTRRAPAARPARLRLLLVEDHLLTLKTLARLLTAEGHEVTTAKTVAEALRAAADGRFDLLISDIGLPDGSGLDLMPVLHDRYGIPGIALSGFGAGADVDASRHAGFLAHLTKPVTIEALRDVLGQFAAARQDGSSANIGPG